MGNTRSKIKKSKIKFNEIRTSVEEQHHVGIKFPEYLGCKDLLIFKGYNPQSKIQLLYLIFAYWNYNNKNVPQSIYIPFNYKGIKNIVYKLNCFDD